MIREIKQGLARKLRAAASVLDGRQFIDARWNRLNVESMNAYIGKTERYVVALERLIMDLAPTNESWADIVGDLRQKHHRFDTQRILDAGAWPEVPEPPPYRTGEA